MDARIFTIKHRFNFRRVPHIHERTSDNGRRKSTVDDVRFRVSVLHDIAIFIPFRSDSRFRSCSVILYRTNDTSEHLWSFGRTMRFSGRRIITGITLNKIEKKKKKTYRMNTNGCRKSRYWDTRDNIRCTLHITGEGIDHKGLRTVESIGCSSKPTRNRKFYLKYVIRFIKT